MVNHALTLNSSKHEPSAFYWGTTLAAIVLLFLNRWGRRAHMQTNLLVAYIFSSLPPVLFNILRGTFGTWVAFLAVATHLLFPEHFSVSRFLLIVLPPSWLVHVLRAGIGALIYCIVIGAFILVEQYRGIGGFSNICENSNQGFYFVCIFFLLFIPILYLIMGGW